MLKETWPDLVTKCPLPASDEVWEGTRFGIDQTLPQSLRKRILGELVCAYLEFCLQHGVKQIIGVMPIVVWKAVFARSGWPVEHLGEFREVGGDKIVAGSMDVSQENLACVRKRMGINHPVLRTAQTVFEQSMEKAA